MVIVFDLDDTLYDEIDFVKSGFREISLYLKNEKYYATMIDIYEKEGSGKVFNKLIETYNLDVSLDKLIEIYRFHKPNISLSDETKKLLEYGKNFQMSLISDGHYIMQKNKFEALGLEQYIEHPIFTDFYHTNKPQLKPYQMIQHRYEQENKYIYISDNPKKDFIAVKELDWIGIRYKNPIGIYKDLKNDTDFEVTSKKDIVTILMDLNNE